MNIEYIKEKRKGEIADIISRYPADRKKSALLPLLHIAQEENGWLPVDAMDEVADILDIKPIEVYEVATFYSMFNLKPVGKYLFEVCQTGPCMLNGSDDIATHSGFWISADQAGIG